MNVTESPGAGGLPRLLLSHPSGSRAEVYLHGAHVTSWAPAGGGEALFVSRESSFVSGSPIRGGIPVVFPQFSDRGPLPKHGFARTLPWRRASGRDEGGPLRLELVDDAGTRALWPHPFRAELQVEIEADSLAVALVVENRGAGSFSFTAALHSYLRVADVRQVRVEGLQGVRYLDQAAGGVERTEEAERVELAGEVDRIYLRAPSPLRVVDAAAGRTVGVSAEGFADAVVWNPGPERARALPDLGDHEYREMVCVEAARIGEPVVLEAGGRWRGGQRLQLLREADGR